MTYCALVKILQSDVYLPKKVRLLGIIKINRSPLSVLPKIQASQEFDIIPIMDFRKHNGQFKLITPELWDIVVVSKNKKLLDLVLYIRH